ncbi:acetylxylan esterase [Mahella australiensis]|uniref:Acetyl xylan esterase n=1 Tax=Mahella australiensis (strain DSM 15567 / CIP 107919 / 50-1 BON) TaxID=697281 RepID=F4A0L3_MAHA5|nr:acetylxylan esterase [Mahella australiensis]AEE95892.1 putative acetyl xylan esterase [Mahella australiensis 50-1 BON]
MLQEMIKHLQLPKLLEFADGTLVRTAQDWYKRRKEILSLLCDEEYGLRPPEPSAVSATIQEVDEAAYAGKVIEQHLMLSVKLNEHIFCFPLHIFIPKFVKNPMLIVYIAFRPDIPDRYLPLEEITDEGFALATFCYNDVAADREDYFTGRLAGLLKKDGQRAGNDTGKLMMWSWAASRVMDYLETRNDIDRNNIAIMGHSRLGKTALITGAYDERFTFTFPNDAGCSGDAITREKEGERVKQITDKFPYWFCPNYRNYAERETQMPFDQHFLVAAIAPRYVSAGTAIEDTWADPNKQYLSYVAADDVYKLLGKKGFIHPDRLPDAGDIFHDGTVGFHMRTGTHFHSRYDWLCFMEFMKKHRVGKL